MIAASVMSDLVTAVNPHKSCLLKLDGWHRDLRQVVKFMIAGSALITTLLSAHRMTRHSIHGQHDQVAPAVLRLFIGA
jgi:hypothetical protein